MREILGNNVNVINEFFYLDNRVQYNPLASWEKPFTDADPFVIIPYSLHDRRQRDRPLIFPHR